MMASPDSPPRVHVLKTYPQQFIATLSGVKRVELRVNDRDFQVGDVLHLREYNPELVDAESPYGPGSGYSGRSCRRTVTHIQRGGEFGLADNSVALSVTVA